MPRKSADAVIGEIWRASHAPPPPDPPEGLSPEAARYWCEIAGSRPHDYFVGANAHMLACLCHHLATADVIWGQIHACDPTDPANLSRYSRLLVMASREGRMATLLMTKLRLFPPKSQAAKAEAAPQMKPWLAHV